MIVDFTTSKIEDELAIRHFMYQVLEDPGFAAQVLVMAKKTLSNEMYKKVKSMLTQLRENFANAGELRRAWRSNSDLFVPTDTSMVTKTELPLLILPLQLFQCHP